MTNIFRADFHKWRKIDGLQAVTIRQQSAMHTLMFLDYRITRNQQFLFPDEDSPVRVTFGNTPLGVRMSYGYVNHLEERVDENGKPFTRLVAVGTSKPMNAGHPRSWDGFTRSGIARDIATNYRLRSVVHSHPAVMDTWSSGAMSDFKALRTLAQEIGYRMWVDGATLWFLDPTRVLSTSSMLTTKTVPFSDQERIEVLRGSNVPGAITASKRVLQYGLDPSTNKVFLATGGALEHPTEMLTSAATSVTQAAYTTDAVVRDQQEQEMLKATVSGDAAIIPGTPVRLESGKATTRQRGLWLVSEAEHAVTPLSFTTRLVASRDRDRGMTSHTPDTVLREGPQAVAVVRNERTWEAAYQERVYV